MAKPFLLPCSAAASVSSPTGPSEEVRGQAEAWLDKCLPVLNGLLFTKPANKAWLLAQTALPTCLQRALGEVRAVPCMCPSGQPLFSS